MGSRLNLHEELCELNGTRNVYFQPPASVKMNYPCIVYSKSNVEVLRADDRLYKGTNRYEVTVIDYDPDSELPDMILEHFQMCSFDSAYVADNLNHFVLTLYY